MQHFDFTVNRPLFTMQVFFLYCLTHIVYYFENWDAIQNHCWKPILDLDDLSCALTFQKQKIYSTPRWLFKLAMPMLILFWSTIYPFLNMTKNATVSNLAMELKKLVNKITSTISMGKLTALNPETASQPTINTSMGHYNSSASIIIPWNPTRSAEEFCC